MIIVAISGADGSDGTCQGMLPLKNAKVWRKASVILFKLLDPAAPEARTPKHFS